MKLFISPQFNGEDKGDGGIRRVVEAQIKHLPYYGVDIVNNETEADIIAVHAGVWVNTTKPVVAHCHGLYWSEYEWPNWAHQLNNDVIETMRKADAITAPSKWVAYAIARGMWEHATVLYHGIDAEEWEPGTNKGYVLWNKTRIDPICDPTPMNEIAALAPTIKFKSTFGNPAANVEITGRLPYATAQGLIKDAAVYLATTRETFGIGTLEAMACGVPVLGFRWGGQAEFIDHKVDGYLSTPGDFDDLKRGLDFILDNRESLGKAAREKVLKNFTWRNVMAGYASLYNDVLSGAKEPRPKVTVVVPAYNLADLLPDTLNSIKTQSFTDWECIIVNDSSTDNTKEVAEQFVAEDPKFKLINNSENLYLAGALNVGARAARGEYILPLDADNMLAENALQLLSYALDNDRSIDIAYGAMEVIDPDGRRYVSTWPPESFSLYAQLNHRNQITSTAMYRHKAWQRVGGYRRRCRTAEDADFWCRMTSFGAHAKKVTQAVILIYRNRHESMSHANKDWPWEAWYPWGTKSKLMPFAAQYEHTANESNVPSAEPPLISVIIPVGPGHTEYVIDAIDSIVAQSFTKWEIVVANDSGESIPWLPPFVNVVTTGGSRGPARARNLAISNSRAPLFIPLDADDYLQPNALEAFFKAWQEHRGYIYSDWIVQETGERKESPDYNCEEVLQKLPHPVTALYSKRDWEAVHGFDEDMQAWEDWDFVIALSVNGVCGTRLPYPLIQYRVNAGKRREAMYADKERLREFILNKWRPYITGEKETMACGGCGKRNSGGIPATPKIAQIDPPSGDMILIEYTKQTAGTATYTSPTNKSVAYRFGSDPAHRKRYVLKADATFFLSRPEFRLAEEVVVDALQAVGPPQR